MALAAALACVGAGLAGCGSVIPVEQLGPPVEAQTVQADQQQTLRFEVIPHSVRVDVIRQTHEERVCTTDSDGDRDCTTKTENDPYQPVGVYLGRGLYLDAGLNLSLVPDRIWHGPLIPQDFQRVTINGPLGSWNRVTLTQHEGTVTAALPIRGRDTRWVRDNANQTTMKVGTLKPLEHLSKVVIQRTDEGIDVQTWAPNIDALKAMARVEIRVNGSEVTVRPFGVKGWVDTKITYGDNHVTVQPFGGRLTRVDISKHGEEIRVDDAGPAVVTTQRGQHGLNESAGVGKLMSHAHVKVDGDRYALHTPGLFGRFNRSAITVEP